MAAAVKRMLKMSIVKSQISFLKPIDELPVANGTSSHPGLRH